VIGAMQLLSGLMLLSGKFVPLGLTILSAILFNIWAFHLLMEPAGIVPGAVATLLWAVVFSRYRESFAGILRP
jgi:putative oxidoreductase